MTGEQLHADVVAELFWDPKGRHCPGASRDVSGGPPASDAGQARPFTR